MRRHLTILEATILAASVLAGAAVVIARPSDPTLYPPRPCPPHVLIFLTSNGYHAELALPSVWLRSQGGAAAMALDRLAPAPWVSIGWGDAEFFRGAGLSAARVLDGLRALGPDNPSVIRLTPLNRSPDLAFKRGVLPIELPEAGAERLLQRLDRSFRTVARRPLRVPALQAGDESAYFASAERFSIAKTCNEWIGQLLNAAGLRTTPILDIAPQPLMWEARRRTAELPGCSRGAH